MTWLRQLDEIQAADLPLAGHQAYCLGQLHRGGLPVADGWVLTAEAWYNHLDHVLWPDQTQDGLAHLEAHLEVGAFQSLQQLSQGMQRVFQAANQPQLPKLEGFPWAGTDLQSSPALAWMLQASLWVDVPAHEAMPDLIVRPGLPAQIGSGPAPAFRQGLLRFWQQALTAPSLLVWRHHCHRLRDLGLATLVMPVYPAQVSGTLRLTTDQANLEAVQGLGLALSRGEAIPARCQLPLAQLLSPSPPHGSQGGRSRFITLIPILKTPILKTPISKTPISKPGRRIKPRL
ncbi:MAG: hypothetical protein HC922_08160 [Leptolyngbyaceae cyanobacterium SM2_3_12]|nr:hypothetical protein [Leptolyngbyaceae cyanobacterium SM2_3_12]